MNYFGSKTLKKSYNFAPNFVWFCQPYSSQNRRIANSVPRDCECTSFWSILIWWLIFILIWLPENWKKPKPKIKLDILLCLQLRLIRQTKVRLENLSKIFVCQDKYWKIVMIFEWLFLRHDCEPNKLVWIFDPWMFFHNEAFPSYLSQKKSPINSFSACFVISILNNISIKSWCIPYSIHSLSYHTTMPWLILTDIYLGFSPAEFTNQ